MAVEVTVPEEYYGDVMGTYHHVVVKSKEMINVEMPKLLRQKFHYQKCLDMQLIYEALHKGEEHTQCYSHTIKKHQNQLPKKLLKRIAKQDKLI